MGHTSRRSHGVLLPGLGLLLALASPAWAMETLFPEKDATRALAVSTPDGTPLGEGSLTQWNEGDRLHVVLTYRYEDGRHIDESAVFRHQPELVQERWTWRERMGGQTTRQFAIDFGTGHATGFTHQDGKTRRYDERLKVEPGRTFAGAGFAVAAKNLLPRLRQGEDVKLQVLAFTPKPRKAQVKLSLEGTESLGRGGKTLTADRVVIHPEIGLASLIVKAPDAYLYFAGSEPPVMVGGEGPLLGPGDPRVRTEYLPPRQAPAAARRPPQPSR
ncbi:hypothetical protein [Archangium sp.]|uniref:hypothetical protein n=1 Tax=Archangium sp. TaxID=1872627 RepID=UPI002D24AAEF|nr:hypothetical protein [Archangium sp.]HYO58877.1 hypothetical protein [Archangium sp.]